MKTTQVILMLIIGIVIGYLIRMAVHPRGGDDTRTEPKVLPVKISAAEAQDLINNYIGKQLTGPKKSFYYFLSDEVLAQIDWVRRNYNSDGSVVYVGSETPDSEEYDVAIIGRLDGTTPEGTYFKVNVTKGTTGLCPYICDVPEPDGKIPTVAGEEEVPTEEEAPSEETPLTE